MNIEIRELTDADLDLVSGAGIIEPEGWVYCPYGSKKGGGDGLYPANGDPCASGTLVQVTVSAVIAGAKKAAGQPQ